MFLNRKYTIKLKYLLIAGVIVILCISDFFIGNNQTSKTTTSTTIETVKALDSAINNNVATKKPTKVPVAINLQTKQVRKIKNTDTIAKNEEKLQLNEIKDTLKLKNATIFSTILTNGIIYSHKAVAETTNTIVTKTTTTKKSVPTSVTFVNAEAIFNVVGQVSGGQISIDRTIKNKFRFGGGLLYINSQPYATFKIGIKL